MASANLDTHARRTANDIDRGTAYGRPRGTHDAYLTEVGPGTPCGEFMRRYWHPIALSADATSTPMQVRILGEDLILFRNGRGEPGLLHPRCVHRGTSLYYGKCEDDGIRCCYHGWKFAVDGNCLDQPGEPKRDVYPQSVRQPWYPVEDRYGLIWAYMGPPDRKPILPRYEIFENLNEGEYLSANDMGRSTGGLGKRFVAPWNWLQHWENWLDPAHVPILHVSFSGFQLHKDRPTQHDPWTFEPVENGVQQTNVSYYDDGRRVTRHFEARFPTEKRAADSYFREGKFFSIGWVTPVDDTSIVTFQLARFGPDRPERFVQLDFGGRSWDQLTPEERRETPGDYEAQCGQGPITLHSEEHLVNQDRGIVLLRRMLRKEIEKVEQGGDPAGLIFDPSHEVVKVEGGLFFDAPGTY